jgi:hypothetical protein
MSFEDDMEGKIRAEVKRQLHEFNHPYRILNEAEAMEFFRAESKRTLEIHRANGLVSLNTKPKTYHWQDITDFVNKLRSSDKPLKL